MERRSGHETGLYTWPPLLLRAPRPPMLVYLDLNHWIGLAKAATGHRDGARHHDTLALCMAAKHRGSALFPLSATHYMEMLQIRDPAQRKDIARIMEELSGFATLLPRDLVITLEIDAVLTERVGASPRPVLALPFLGFGVAWTAGKLGDLRIRSPEGDATDQVREQWVGGPEQFDAWRAQAELTLERSVLAGPQDDQLDDLRAYGWKPEHVITIMERRAAEERAQAARLDAEPNWRRGRLRDVISVREVIIELFDRLKEGLTVRGRDLADVWHDRDSAQQMVNSMPSTDVAVTIKTAAHRNRYKSWSRNDIHDIDALSVAVPYCDITVTEAHAHHVLHAAHTPMRTSTTVLRRLGDLTPLLKAGTDSHVKGDPTPWTA